MHHRKGLVIAACVTACASSALAQSFSRAITAPYRIAPNVTYVKSGTWEGKLDIYSQGDSGGPRPTVIWVHGGDSLSGSKDGATFNLLTYLEWGWNVVNVEHRLAGVTLAPAALQNCLCAVRWVIRNAVEYGFDTTKLVISGASSGDGSRWRLASVYGRMAGTKRAQARRISRWRPS